MFVFVRVKGGVFVSRRCSAVVFERVDYMCAASMMRCSFIRWVL